MHEPVIVLVLAIVVGAVQMAVPLVLCVDAHRGLLALRERGYATRASDPNGPADPEEGT